MSEPSDHRTAQELFAPDYDVTGTRDRIIVTALDMFYEQGFHAVGLDRIIREVGVTKTTFYNHFESKDELIAASIKMRDDWENEAFARTVASFSDDTPRGTILAIFDALDQWFTAEAFKGCMFIAACAEFPSATDPAHVAAAAHFVRTTETLQALCDQLGIDDAAGLVRQLELLIEGAVVMRLITSDDTTARTARVIAERLLDAAEAAS